jgi:hypothetical protein
VSFFAQLGKHLANGSATLINGAPSATLFTPIAGEWTDIYSIVISTDDTSIDLVTVSDGTTSLVYYVGGGSGGNPPVVDQASVPVRFGKGIAITATASSVTAGKHIAVNIRGLTSKT